MRKNIRIPLLATLWFIFAITTIATAAEFRANVEQNRELAVRQGRIWVKDGIYRLAMEQPNGPDLYIIVGAKPETTQVVFPKYKAYVELASDDVMSQMNDPFQAAVQSAKRYTVKTEGAETVQGLNCNRQLIHYKGTGVMRRWVATELEFPIKIEQLSQENYSILLNNIETVHVPEKQLQIPASFALKTEEQIKQLVAADPSVAAKAAAYEKSRPRKSERRVLLSEGDTYHLILTPGTRWQVNARPFGSSDTASWFAVPYNGQTALKTKAECTYSGKSKVKKDPASGADGISIGAVEGEISVAVTLIGPLPHVQAIQSVYTKKKGQGSSWGVHLPFRTYQVRLYALSEPAAGVRFKAAGKKHQLKIPAGEYREFSYTDQDNLENLDIMMDYGEVKVVCIEDHRPEAAPHILLGEQASTAGLAVSAANAGQAADASRKNSSSSQSVPTPSTAAATSASTGDGTISRMVLVLDASGSMWGQIKGKAKIQIAKEVLTDLIDAIPTDFQTGLAVYGHRRKGDCNDIEMMLPVGKHNAAVMKSRVTSISPKGKTPLGESVKRAAEALGYTEERATVVLVSDGLETCDIDPCELAAELAMKGVDFTVHVIGFDISREDQEELRCLADKTGGLFLAATDAGSLRDALFRTVEEVKAPPVPVVEDPGIAVLKGPAAVPVGSAFTVQWEGPDSRGDLIVIEKKGDPGTRYEDYVYTKRGNPAKLTAPGVVGDYELRYVHGHSRKVIGRADLKATPVEVGVTVPATARVAVDLDVTWQGPDYPGDYIAIARPGTDRHNRIHYTYTRNGSPLKLQAPSEPGTYGVRYILGKSKQVLAETSIEIQAASATVQAPATADVASEFEVVWQGPNNRADYIAIVPPGQGADRRINYTYTKEGSPLQLLAPSAPGIYDVIYVMAQGKKVLAKTTTEIKPVGASVQAPASAAAASLINVTWQGPNNQGDYIAIVPPGQGANQRINYTYTKKGSPLQVRTPSDPATYDVIYLMSQGKRVLAQTTIEIKPVSAEINPPATAGTNTKIEIPWQGPGYDSDQITISRPDQTPGSRITYRYTNRGNPAVIKTPKKPGSYEVRYILGQGKKVLTQKTITIK